MSYLIPLIKKHQSIQILVIIRHDLSNFSTTMPENPPIGITHNSKIAESDEIEEESASYRQRSDQEERICQKCGLFHDRIIECQTYKSSRTSIKLDPIKRAHVYYELYYRGMVLFTYAFFLLYL
ncbi:hypothetical protein BpHYR1_030921 [Brachionus plicatilis]|uniref:Uncharacterized protein n=1 Tax=Brachionus plicatilis TaxID=10195 RepID=A0A3M7Q9X0_BRAPC|nr:hypothetical protein BpHYR1_030921 [Brachionus plicatilis]